MWRLIVVLPNFIRWCCPEVIYGVWACHCGDRIVFGDAECTGCGALTEWRLETQVQLPGDAFVIPRQEPRRAALLQEWRAKPLELAQTRLLMAFFKLAPGKRGPVPRWWLPNDDLGLALEHVAINAGKTYTGIFNELIMGLSKP